MAINLRIDDEDADGELRSLYDWLLREPDVRTNAEIRLVAKEPAPGEMGDTLDLITLLITAGLQLPQFADTLATWLGTRRRRPRLTIERGATKVVVDDPDSEAIERVLRDLWEADDRRELPGGSN